MVLQIAMEKRPHDKIESAAGVLAYLWPSRWVSRTPWFGHQCTVPWTPSRNLTAKSLQVDAICKQISQLPPQGNFLDPRLSLLARGPPCRIQSGPV